MTYDPLTALRALRVPALFLFGADDRLIPVEKSVSAIREVLTQGRADFTIQVFDGRINFPASWTMRLLQMSSTSLDVILLPVLLP